MPHVVSQICPVLGPIERGTAREWPEQDGVEVDLEHLGGATSRIRMTLLADRPDTVESIEFTGAGRSTTSPADPLDSVAAHQAATGLIMAGGPEPADVLLGATQLRTAAQATAVMADLAAQVAALHIRSRPS
jgi:hypothetical protein